MSKRRSRSTLYRLIEAGQLTRRALAAPLVARGLEPGDDAVLFLLGESGGATAEELADGLGLAPVGLDVRLRRLIGQGLVARRAAVGADAIPELALTEVGEGFYRALSDHWEALDASVGEKLPRKTRKHLNKALKDLVSLLKG